jgi:hypothetical protein
MRIVFVMIAAMLVARVADACSCLPLQQPCEAVWKSRHVFTGTVTAIRSTADQDVVTFRVERTWRDDIPGRSLPPTVIVSTPRDGAACGYAFVRGRTYLVYAGSPLMNAARLFTGLCTRTRPIEHAAEDLAYFSEMESRARTSRISGQVRPLPDDVSPPPVEGLLIELRTAAGLRTTTTDANGSFEFRGLPVQMYEVAARVPETYVPARSREAVFLAHPTACAEIDLYARWDGQVAGAVVDSTGAAVPNLEIEVRRSGMRFGVPVTTDDDGRFTFAGLGPGTYTIGINLSRHRPEGGQDPVILRDGISLGPGKRVSAGTLRVPPR